MLGNHAVVNKEDAAADLAGKRHLVRDDDGGHALLCQFPDDSQNLLNHFRVKGGGGLIKEDDVGIHCQRPDDGEALFLSAGERPGKGISLILQADALQKCHGSLICLFLRQNAVAYRSEGDVFLHGNVGKHVEVLEHHDITTLIKNTIRVTDRLFRWGGDEFIVLFPDLNTENALVVVNKIIETVDSYHFDIEGKSISISFGIGSYNCYENMDQFISRVDKALLRAKATGKHTIEQC